jgi:hypothetical protein
VASSHRERAREQFPSVLLGVLGIIQALALELLWQEGIAGLDRWRALEAGLAGQLQVLSVFLGVIVTWLMYATLVLRFAWVPRFADLVFPFVLGALEFLLVEWTAPERIAAFFLGLALIFGLSASMTFWTFRAMIAAGDVADRPFRVQIAGYYPAAIAVAALAVCAWWAGAAGPASRVTTACLVAANLVLLAQIAMFRHYWRMDVAPERARRR